MHQTETKGQQTRQRILDSAMDLLNTKGYHATTMNDIIAATGAQKGNLYYHFPGKEALVIDLVKSAGKTYGEYLSGRSGSGSPVERLYGILDAVLDFHRDRGLKGGCLFGNLAMETADTVPAVAESVKGVLDSGIDWIATLISKAKESGEIRYGQDSETDSRTLALRIVAGIEGSILLARLGKDIKILENAVKDLKTELSSAIQ
ncbi:TetR/AcrR family transcriptional regulator [Desulforegula conservatrix]|uniref:TetR/AcrR family transcriptional regulator n=1 Tax=Desulforegula conservatrix TaxID=153026 RepID=UPI0004263EE0|nr:TetR/AcrR family transcriptional regulator [Desulforegula conservatrix]